MLTKLMTVYQEEGNYNSIKDRVYTLTHSDQTGERTLFIGDKIDKKRINPLRDEVEGRWILRDKSYYLQLVCNLYSQYSKLSLEERYKKFKSHIVRALVAIINGDREFIQITEGFDHKVVVHYKSPENVIIEDLGYVRDYIL